MSNFHGEATGDRGEATNFRGEATGDDNNDAFSAEKILLFARIFVPLQPLWY